MFSQGYGTLFYNDMEYYEGEWYADKRCGWGRMFYEDGSVYEGEWDDDKCNGRGMLRLSKNHVGMISHFHASTTMKRSV